MSTPRELEIRDEIMSMDYVDIAAWILRLETELDTEKNNRVAWQQKFWLAKAESAETQTRYNAFIEPKRKEEG